MAEDFPSEPLLWGDTVPPFFQETPLSLMGCVHRQDMAHK